MVGEHAEVQKRYAAIYARWEEIGNYSEVGRENGLTGDHIRQICLKWERMKRGRLYREGVH